MAGELTQKNKRKTQLPFGVALIYRNMITKSRNKLRPRFINES